MKLPTSNLTLSHGWSFRDLPLSLRDELSAKVAATNPQWLSLKNYSPYGYVPYSIPQTIYFLIEEKGAITVPRGVNLERVSKEFRQWLFDNPAANQQSGKKFNSKLFPRLTLNPEQRKLYNQAVAQLPNRPAGNLLLLAPTAVGKTILQAYLAFKLGYKTLVVFPTALVKRAWLTDLAKLFGLSSKDVGLIQQNVWRIGKNFTLASMATLQNRRDRWEELHREFGTLVLDEVQGISAPNLYAFVSRFTGRYLIGATATNLRNGKPIPELELTFGPAVAKMDANDVPTANSVPVERVEVVKTSFIYEIDPEDSINWHALALEMAADETRNAQIVANCLKDWKAGRSLLVVTKRHEHVEMLADMLKEAGIPDVNRLTGLTTPDRRYTDILLRGVSKRDVRCLVATSRAITVGANMPALDTLHMAIPPVYLDSIEQLLGRIRRKHDDRKHPAKVVWYLDVNVSYLRDHVFERRAVKVFQKMKIKGYETPASQIPGFE